LLSIALAVFIPFLLAVAGGILAVRALPSETSLRERYRWIGGFVFLFVIGIVLSFWQQVRATNHDQVVSQAEKEKEIRAEGEIRYTQGQLDSIHKILADVVNSNALNSPGAIRALFKGALQAARSTEGIQAPAIQGMPPKQLRSKIIDFANAIRKACADYMNEAETDSRAKSSMNMSKEERDKAWQEYSNRVSANLNKFNLILEQQFVGDSTVYRDELLRRLRLQNPPPSAQTWWKSDGLVVVGYQQASATADYLEALAKQLP
jgi:hypothetical protein